MDDSVAPKRASSPFFSSLFFPIQMRGLFITCYVALCCGIGVGGCFTCCLCCVWACEWSDALQYRHLSPILTGGLAFFLLLLLSLLHD